MNLTPLCLQNDSWAVKSKQVKAMLNTKSEKPDQMKLLRSQELGVQAFKRKNDDMKKDKILR